MYRFHKDGTLPTDMSVWVFGSNLAGRHGKGAAKVARDVFGARQNVAVGLVGHSYAIPTKDENLRVLPLWKIQEYVRRFLRETSEMPEINFFVTRIGCGLAGYKDEDIAPMFRGALGCSFAEEWRPYLKGC